MGKLAQADFGGGIWRELDAPQGYVYDAVNAVVDGTDLRLRGPITRRGAEASTQLSGLAAATLAGGPRVVGWTDTALYVLADDGSSWSTVTSTGSEPIAVFSRPVVYGGAMVMRCAFKSRVWAYAGSRKANRTDTLTVANGSTTVTGTGTAFMTDVDPGMMFLDYLDALSVVDEVASNTELSLVYPRISGLSGIAADLGPVVPFNPRQTPGLNKPLSPLPFTSMAVAGNKLLLAVGTKVWMSRAFDWNVNDNEFHDAGSPVIGLESFGNAALVFTTSGVYVIENVALDLTDEAGNPQQQLRLLSPNVVLWNDSGIAAWEGRVVVPALDGVFLFSPGEPPVEISRPIGGPYRSYVAAGYRPGLATVFHGHYFLPIVSAGLGTLIDVLVCRLDQGRTAWTRWGGSMAPYMLTKEQTGTGGSRLTGARRSGFTYLSDLTGALEPASAAADADGSVPVWDVTTNDMPTGPGNRNTVTRARLRYALTGSAAVRVSYVTGPESGYAETVLSPDGGPGDGEDAVSWRFAKRTARLRFRVQSSGGAATLRLRSLEVFTRDSYRP